METTTIIAEILVGASALATVIICAAQLNKKNTSSFSWYDHTLYEDSLLEDSPNPPKKKKVKSKTSYNNSTTDFVDYTDYSSHHSHGHHDCGGHYSGGHDFGGGHDCGGHF